ncbi:MAG: hypothetical protein WAO21_01720 [Verrucomicrobiia bacterium]
MKSSKKAVKRRNNSERPQNRHLRPWKKGDPNIPKSPGRPRSAWHEFEQYAMEHPDKVKDYFLDPVVGNRRFQRLMDAGMQRRPIGTLRLLWLIGKFDESEPEQQDQRGVNQSIECRSPEENLALELARARAQPGERVESSDGGLVMELARTFAQDSAGFRKIENLRVSAPTMAWLLKLRQEHQERDQEQERQEKENRERLAAQKSTWRAA